MQEKSVIKDKFWIVWNTSRAMGIHKHSEIASAEREAERLARENPGQSFVILQSIKECAFGRVEWAKHSDPIPF